MLTSPGMLRVLQDILGARRHTVFVHLQAEGAGRTGISLMAG